MIDDRFRIYNINSMNFSDPNVNNLSLDNSSIEVKYMAKLIDRIFNRKKVNEQLKLSDERTGKERQIKVRFPSMAGDEDRMMTVQQLQQEYKDYLIIDPRVNEQVDLRKLANLEDINEVVAMPPISGG